MFHSGAKLRKFKFTVRPASQIIVHGPTGPTTEQVKPLRAIFKYGNEHTFDSTAAQEEYGWTDEERELVEKKLQDPSNGYFGRFDERRIYRADLPQPRDLIAQSDEERCIGVNIIEGTPKRCDKKSIEGSLYCDDHVLETVSGPTVATCPLPVEENGVEHPCGQMVIEGSEFCAEHDEMEKATVPEKVTA